MVSGLVYPFLCSCIINYSVLGCLDYIASSISLLFLWWCGVVLPFTYWGLSCYIPFSTRQFLKGPRPAGFWTQVGFTRNVFFMFFFHVGFSTIIHPLKWVPILGNLHIIGSVWKWCISIVYPPDTVLWRGEIMINWEKWGALFSDKTRWFFHVFPR